MDTVQIFVYGTLKPQERNYLPYCAGRTIAEVRAYTFGNLYHLPVGYPGMTVGEHRVEGFLFTFGDASILEPLDRLEDYSPQRSPVENHYNRQRILVYDPTGRSLGQAWGYVMRLATVQSLQGVLVPSGWWTETF